MPENLKAYSDDELVLRVFNEEDLYLIRHDVDLVEVLNERFIYTNPQHVALLDQLEEDEV